MVEKCRSGASFQATAAAIPRMSVRAASSERHCWGARTVGRQAQDFPDKDVLPALVKRDLAGRRVSSTGAGWASNFTPTPFFT